ncbi:unnamed protein product, partial [Ectocarpus sp. 4 AP-2014]
MKIELEKVLTATVDAKAAAKHDSEETKQKKADDAASHSAVLATRRSLRRGPRPADAAGQTH